MWFTLQLIKVNTMRNIIILIVITMFISCNKDNETLNKKINKKNSELKKTLIKI